MPLKEIDMVSNLEPIEFVVPEVFPKGYVSFGTAREGVGKTTLLTGLLWQMSRPLGGTWLDFEVQSASSIFVNTDAPDGRSRPVRYWLDKHRNAYPDGDLGQITVLEAEGLGQEELNDIAKIAKERKAQMIVIDSYMGSFSGLDPSALEQQMGPLKALVQLAAQTGAAVVVTDHHSKGATMSGEFTAMGSVSKSAQSRAGVSFTRVPPADCEGLNVIRFEVVKQSFGRRLEPFGVHIRVERLDPFDSTQECVYLERYALPDTKTDTGRYRAKLAILAFLKAHLGVWYTRKDLMQEGCKGGNVKERTAIDALSDAIKELSERVEEHQGQGKSATKKYRLLAEGQVSGSGAGPQVQPQPEPLDSAPPRDSAPLPSENNQNLKVQTEEDF